MDEIITRLAQLPSTIKGYTIIDKTGDFNIYINAAISREQQLRTYQHELEHIRRGDYSRKGPVDLIEIMAHRA